MNIAILGAGTIANKMAKTILAVEGANAYAVAARDLSRAEKFKDQYAFETAYGSYAEMLADEKVDLVYVATTHNCHYEQVKMCLLAGKHVLCEKSFTLTADEARELCQISEEKNLLLAEAMWTRYLPIYQTLNEVLAKGEIGEVSSAVINFGGNLKKERVWRKDLGGGALLDLGVYVITAARLIFKGSKIEKIVSLAAVNEDKIDYVDNIIIKFEGKKTAILQANQSAVMSSRLEIFGSTGYIEMDSVMNPQRIKIFGPGSKLLNTYERPEQVTGFEYELIAAMNAIMAGKVEVEELPHKEMIYIMEIMENLLKEWCE